MKKKYLPLLLLLSIQTYNSQSLSTNNNFDLPKIVPPSQETFANSRINFEQSSSGEFNYELPIYGGIKTPISLSYISGVKVDDIGTSTGMSWQLNAGGVISRVVKDETDENKENWRPDTVNETADLQKIRNAAKAGNVIDTEYDWFNFSTSNGLSGSFYIDKDLNVFIESKDNVKIEISVKTAPVSVYGKLLEFKLTDKFGTEYYFGGTETNTEKTTYENSGPNEYAVTGWYLYKILTPEKRETSFNYATEPLNYYVSLNAQFNVQQNCSIPASTQYTYSGINKTKSTIQSYKPRLVSIVEDDKQISFIYNKERKDLFNSTPENNLLTSVEIKYGNQRIHKYDFEYLDVQSSTVATYYGLPSTENSTKNRHFLKSLVDTKRNVKTEFEYNSLELLPSRFSLSTDYYGYVNGVNNLSPFPSIASDNNFGIFNGFSNIVPSSIFSADKKVKPSLASVGNLKKIIHPTKGVSEILYEPNSSMGQVNEVVKETGFISVNYNKCNLASDNPVDSFTFVSNGAPIEYYGTAFFDSYFGCGEPSSDLHSLKITNLTTGTIVFSGNKNVSDPFNAVVGTNYSPVSTVAGNIYQVEYSVSSRLGVVSGNIFVYYNEHTATKTELIYFGGNRVSSIKESDVEGHNYTRKFYYSKLNDIGTQKTSIAEYNAPYLMAQKQETSKSCSNGGTMPGVEIRDVYSAYQNSLLPFFSHRRNKIFYSDITEVIENKSAVERKFSYYNNQDPYIGRQPEIYNIPKTNYGELKSNLLQEENQYKFENGIYQKIINKTYQYNYEKIKSLKSYVFRENFTYNPDPAQDQLLNISYGFYENYYGFYNPTEIKTTEYFPNNVTITTTNTNTYSTQNHYQLTSAKTQFPDLSTQTTSYSYAHEKGNQKLINANIVGVPLETTTILKESASASDVIVSKEETKYEGTHLFPSSITTQNLLNSASITTEITYDQYDSKGNLQQYTTKDGIPVAIVWGYNQTQPIAKIEGVTYTQVSSLASAIVTASNTDASAAINNDESALLTALDNFRNNSALSGYQVSTYTYDPLIGVRSITPPSGIREYYIYDSANRLEKVVDSNGNILKEYKYNYKQ
ncbi:RHS repeat domain-containing protein [Chryseobacterium sp. CT-SW4]|uniref:hypothetical protein n=1 Tax=Chryseobacterium sp. SW-1 TaxID=3157343 RepID=UPI003B0217C6